jgi:predicted nucleic acid-binding protein
VIVVDTNVLAYLLIPGEHTEAARRALERDPEWAAPVLWRSEFRSVLAGYLRQSQLDLADAVELVDTAAAILEGSEFHPDGAGVLRLVVASTCSAYDCEFVALGEELGVPLVTSDERLLRDFPEATVALEEFGRG